MPNESTTIVQRLWNYCNVLRDDGVSYGDYVEQLTYLLFLKMADEQTKPPFSKPSIIPKNLDWPSLLKKDGDALEVHYRHILESLGKAKGMLGVIFRKSQNKIQDPAKLKRLLELINDETWVGMDIDVDGAARLCVMNLYLHGIGGEESPIVVGDSLVSDPGGRFNLVLTNPPFGKKSSITIVNGEGKADREVLIYERQDFWATTSNKQLDFLQHVKTLLEMNGKATIVVPDNVLFEGGAGETVRRKLLAECDVHTLLRLPTGVFYAQGVKANVLFFDRRPAREKPWTEKLWIYDLRTNQHFTLKPIRCVSRICRISSNAIIRRTISSAERRNGSKLFRMTNCCNATK
jgi:type I restriction-modification system DNA methylase subunit